MSANSAEKERAIVLEASHCQRFESSKGFEESVRNGNRMEGRQRRTTAVGGHWASSPGRETRL